MSEFVLIIILAIGGFFIYLNRNWIKQKLPFLKTKDKKQKQTYTEDAYGKAQRERKEKYRSTSSYTTSSYGSAYGSNSYSKSSDGRAVNKIMSEMKNDFMKAPYNDKFEQGSTIITYKFENHRRISITEGYQISDSFSDGLITINTQQLGQFLDFIQLLLQNARPGRRGYGNSGRGSNFSNPHKKNINYTEEEIKYQEKFRKLKKNHDVRMANLDKMDPNHPDRPALVNEVNSVKRKMKTMYDKSGLAKEKQ